jgi:hypothetical protein
MENSLGFVAQGEYQGHVCKLKNDLHGLKTRFPKGMVWKIL